MQRKYRDFSRLQAPCLRATKVFAPVIFLLSLLAPLVFVSCTDKGKNHREADTAPARIVWPGDTVYFKGYEEGLPGAAASKVNIGGVVKNALEVSSGQPLLLPAGTRAALGVLPDAADRDVEFRILCQGELVARHSLVPGKAPFWKQVSLGQCEGGTLKVRCDLAGKGAFVAHPGPAVGDSLPSIFFILVDALRADALHAYGADEKTCPNINALARRGLTFERAYSSSPFTLTSVASMFTGLHPWQHRVLFEKDAGLVLSDDVPNLVDLFRNKGYHTAAFSGTYFLMTKNGYANGFDHFDETCAPAFFRKSAECLNNKLIPWVKEHASEPVFAYVHYVDPHAPYYPPKEYRQRFLAGMEKPSHDDVALGEIEQFGKNRKWHQLFRSPSEDDLAYLRALYMAEASYVDEKIGELIRTIRESRPGERPGPIILLTADHGEAFYEHGVMDHVADLHDPVMRVPFILRGPGIPRGMTVEEQVRTIDMIPTLLDLVGAPVPGSIPGRSLVPLIKGEEMDTAPAAAMHYLKGEPEYALAAWPWKLFAGPGRPSRALYRLDKDPDEVYDLAASQPKKLEAMMSTLNAILDMPPPHRKEDRARADGETMKRLKALGYTGE